MVTGLINQKAGIACICKLASLEANAMRALFVPLVRDSLYIWVKVKVKSLSCVRLLTTPWTVAYQTPPSMGFSRQECWSGLPFPSPGDLPDPGIEPGSRIAGRRFYRLSHQGSPYGITQTHHPD